MKRILWVLMLLCLNAVAQTRAPLPNPTPVPIPIDRVQYRCPTVIVYENGLADNFALPADPVHPSLALDAFLQATAIPGLPPVAYDENGECDHHFGDSFKIDSCNICCGICSATLEITMRGCGGSIECNDSITVGVAPFNTAGGVVLWNGYVNGIGCPGDPGPVPVNPTKPDVNAATTKRPSGPISPTIVKKIELDPRKLEELICERHIHYLDVYVQDDQVIDSMRLVITKP